MQFGTIPLAAAEGAILAHAVRAGERLFKKGRVLSEDDLALLRADGVESVVAARLEPDDVPEDEAAARLASRCAGDGVEVAAAFTGRANLYAADAGLVLVDIPSVEAVNAVDEAITLASLRPYTRVVPRQMLATLKIIPFSIPRSSVERAETLLRTPSIRVAPFKRKRLGLISTALPSTNPIMLDKNREVLDGRLQALGSEIVFERRVSHQQEAVAQAIQEAKGEGCDPILVFGASAITDRRDVIPAAIEQAGGAVIHFGMPVDPGNLLLLGELHGTSLIGLPGCARSPKTNGFDFVLWRLLADLPVGPGDLTAMGVGGLLTEIPTRPQPRDERPRDIPRAPKIAAIVLAAGLSSRMGTNKLLEEIDGRPMVSHVVEAAVASRAEPVIVVTGHAAPTVEKALQGSAVSFAHNPDFTGGLSTSLKAGLSAVPADCDGALVLLGDMPGIDAALIDRLIAAFDPAEGRAICMATHHGRRGNPVLWGRRFFPEMQALEGDVGARSLIGAYGELVCEVEAADDGPLADIDTPDALAAWRRRP